MERIHVLISFHHRRWMVLLYYLLPTMISYTDWDYIDLDATRTDSMVADVAGIEQSDKMADCWCVASFVFVDVVETTVSFDCLRSSMTDATKPSQTNGQRTWMINQITWKTNTNKEMNEHKRRTTSNNNQLYENLPSFACHWPSFEEDQAQRLF